VADGEPTYELSFSGKPVVKKAGWGLKLKDLPSFTKGFTIVTADRSQKDETWFTRYGAGKTDS